MSKILIAALLLVTPQLLNASDIDKAYQQILFTYASTALKEFDYVTNSTNERVFSIDNAHFVRGLDKIGRTFYIVLFPENEGSIYVSLELNKDSYLEVHGRGGINITPSELKSNFKQHIGKMIHYPGAT